MKVMQPSTASTVRDGPAGGAFAGHGRSPTIEMRHTVDDKLLVATHATFCSFRALLHRNGDTIVLLSDVGKEIRVRGASVPRGVILTDGHLYVMSLPSNVLFAPASHGGCFSMKEFSRLCTVETTPHAVLQFVNGVVTLLFNTAEDVARLGEVIYSATGVRAEKISQEDLDIAQNGQHYAREGKRYAVSIAPSAASKVSKRESVPSVGASTIAGKRVTGSGGAPSEGGSSSPQVVETMLRHILGGRSGDYEKNFPEEMCQTDPWRGVDASVAVHPQTVERGSSPIGFVEEVVEQQSDASASDFDPSDVWRSLHGGPKHAPEPAPLRKTLTASRFDMSTSVSGIGAGGASGGGTPTAAGLATIKSAPTLQKKLSFAGKQQQQQDEEDAAAEEKVAGRAMQLDSFLGVLSSFLPQLQMQGIDSLNKLLRLSEGEIDELMDTVGMHKQGHRIMFINKIQLAKQSRKK